MTDLLEELLALLPEDEETEETGSWAEGTAAPRIPEGPGAAEEQEGGAREDRPALRTGLAGEAGSPLRRGTDGRAEWSMAETPEGAAGISEEQKMLRRYRQADEAARSAARNGQMDARGAEDLYRQAARGTRALLPAAYPQQPERVTTGTSSLTVDELDRAVRRDSRRYDGGMELY